MSHIAITNMLNGNNVDWLEYVTDEEYSAVRTAGLAHQENNR